MHWHGYLCPLDLRRSYVRLGSRQPDVFRARDNFPHESVRYYVSGLTPFEALNAQVAVRDYVARDGQMIDSSFTSVPIQRNTRDENTKLKAGETPAAWEEGAATVKLRQKDVDARWTKKHGKSFFGYKTRLCVDVHWKLIRGYVPTPANEHDINVLEDLEDPTQKGQPLYADAAYRAEEVERALRAQRIHTRVAFIRMKYQPLTSYQKRENKRRTKVRVQVEHVFGTLETTIGSKRLRCTGRQRASIQTGLQNLLFNLHRLMYLERASPV